MKKTVDKSTLSIAQKTKLLVGKNGWQLDDLDGALYQVSVADGPVGLRKTSTVEWGEEAFKLRDLPSVAYPSIEVLAQTWNTALAYEMGECLANDCIEKGVDVLLAPGINLKRSPINGRNFEYVSEDPLLTGLVSAAYINGLQDHHVGATLKHYLANNNEIGRFWTSSNIDERTLRELYMRGFEIAIQNAHPWAVMCSYNLLNGVRVAQDTEAFAVLRKELGCGDSLIMSDWDAVKDRTASAKAGLDLEMPFHQAHLDAFRKDCEEGRISEAEVDACVERVLDFVQKVEQESKLRTLTRSIDARREVALRIAEEGIVLLKNNGILPLRDGQSIGVSAWDFHRSWSGWGSARVVPESLSEPLPALLAGALPSSRVEATAVWSNDYVRIFTGASEHDACIVVVGYEQGEGNDRQTLSLDVGDSNEWLIKEIARRNPNTVVVMHGGGAVDVSGWIDDVAALVYVGYSGQHGNDAVANVLTGRVNPSGKLAETFAKTRKDYPSEQVAFDGLNYDYAEGMGVGYRYFDKHPEAVRYPFGYGLSYTSFAYSDLTLSESNGTVSVTFSLRNTGARDGAEISQVYVRALDSAVEKPDHELRGFAKTTLSAGETKSVTVTLDERAFSHYCPDTHAWVTDYGSYEILIAENAQSVLLRTTVTIEP